MIMIRLFLVSLFFVCSSAFAQEKITGEKALAGLNNNADIQLLDVRTKKEFDGKHLKDALNVDWRDQANFVSFVQHLDKSKPVYVYCLSGGRSAEAAQKLTSLGYTVYDIEGGILKWEANNLPIIKGEEKNQDTGMTLAEYNAEIQKHKIVLVDFYASWCPPCKKLMPIVDNIEKKYTSKVKVLKIDIDKNDKLYKSLNITGIPMLLIYKDGKNTWSQNGFVEQETIEKHL